MARSEGSSRSFSVRRTQASKDLENWATVAVLVKIPGNAFVEVSNASSAKCEVSDARKDENVGASSKQPHPTAASLALTRLFSSKRGVKVARGPKALA